MPHLKRSALPPLLAAAGLFAGAGILHAQEAGFAVELATPAGSYAELRVAVRQYGPAVEPAAAYVRGCRGHVAGEGAAALFELTERRETLAFTAHGEGLESMVVETPDGLFRCAHADDATVAVAQIADAAAGRYRVWAGAAEGAEIDARIIAADRAVAAMEITGLEVARLGAPRGGEHPFTATAESGRQLLVAGGALYPDESLGALGQDYCPGYSRLDAADAVLVLDAPERRLSIFAMSERDLTLAVAGPDGQVLCNDDSFGLNPAVTFEDAPAGAYHVFVGAFASGPASEVYDLYAAQGGPQFGTSAAYVPGGEARGGTVAHDPRLAARGQHLATAPIVATDPASDQPALAHCTGHFGLAAPDLVLSVEDPGAELTFYATSSTDLVLAVRSPDGIWLCDDDTHGIDPAVTFEEPQPGEYQIHVGAYAQGAEGVFALFATEGEPDWDVAQSPAPETLNASAEPAVGRIAFGPGTGADPRVVFDVPQTEFGVFELDEDCAGYIDPTRPDIVIEAAAGLPQLMIYMVAEADGSLVVVGPDGTLHCNDDFEGLHPGIVITAPEAGSYAVFAGTFDGRGGLATLGVTVSAPNWTMDREG